MSLATSNTSNNYTADGVITAFNFTFRTLPVSSEIQVYLNQVLQSSGYTVSFDASGVGGTVTFNTAPANGVSVYLIRNTTFDQSTTIPVEGTLVSKAVTDALDKLTMLTQWLKAGLGRAFTLSVFTTYVGSMVFPEPVAGNILRVNAAGSALEFATSAQIGLDNNAAYTRLVKLVGYRPMFEHTLSAADVLTPLIITNANATATISIAANGGTTDSLSLVAYSDGTNTLLQDGEEILIRAKTGHTISVLHGASAGDNQLSIILQEGNTLSLTGNKVIRLQRIGTTLVEISKAGFNTNDSYFLRLGGTNQLTSSRPLLNIPAAPTVTVQGATGATTRSYAITDGDPWGTETAVSANGTVANANGTLNGSNFCRITFPTVLSRVYRVYRTVASGTPATTGLIATVTGTGGVVTVDDTNLAASTAAPTVHTWKGKYQHVGNYTLDANVTGTEVDIFIIGDYNGQGNTYTYTGVAPFTGPAQNGETRSGYTGAGLSPGIHGGYTDAATILAPSGAGNGGSGGRGASGTGANLGVPGASAIPIEIFSAGSTGATSGTFTTKGGNAGDAGGRIYIECFGSLTWMTTNCNGGAGTAGSSSYDPGGSGGSGGFIGGFALTANIIPASCVLSANGGAGGNGGSGGAGRYGGGGGGAGKIIQTCEQQDPQVLGSTSSTGGAAGTSTSAATVAQAGSSSTAKIIRMALMTNTRAAA